MNKKGLAFLLFSFVFFILSIYLQRYIILDDYTKYESNTSFANIKENTQYNFDVINDTKIKLNFKYKSTTGNPNARLINVNTQELLFNKKDQDIFIDKNIIIEKGNYILDLNTSEVGKGKANISIIYNKADINISDVKKESTR